MTRRREWASARTLTLSPASSLAVAATLEARATVRLGAATRTLRPVGNGGREGDTVSGVVALETRALLSLAVVCRGAPRRWIGAPATWVSDGPAPVRIRTGEDGRCGGECGHFTCDVRTNGVRARRVVAPRHARSYLLTGHADCVSSSGTPACARRSRFSLAENKRSCEPPSIALSTRAVGPHGEQEHAVCRALQRQVRRAR